MFEEVGEDPHLFFIQKQLKPENRPTGVNARFDRPRKLTHAPKLSSKKINSSVILLRTF